MYQCCVHYNLINYEKVDRRNNRDINIATREANNLLNIIEEFIYSLFLIVQYYSEKATK